MLIMMQMVMGSVEILMRWGDDAIGDTDCDETVTIQMNGLFVLMMVMIRMTALGYVMVLRCR